MPTLIPTTTAHPTASATDDTRARFRPPPYECEDQLQALRLTVYLPGVDAAGVDIVTQGPDLVVTARKARPVRVNWTALQLEAAQLDYRLRLRLGHGFRFGDLQATLHDGVLVLHLPKRSGPAPAATRPAERRRVA